MLSSKNGIQIQSDYLVFNLWTMLSNTPTLPLILIKIKMVHETAKKDVLVFLGNI